MALAAVDLKRESAETSRPTGQLALVEAETLAPTGRGGAVVDDRPSLSERLRDEHVHGTAAASAARARTTVLRRGGEATLDELLVGAWEGLSVHRPVACPVCPGTMQTEDGAGGGCRTCGSRLL